MKYRAAAIASALSICAALAGCGSPPSDEDLRAALSAQMGVEDNKIAKSMFADSIKQAKILGCSKSDGGAYKCDFVGVMGIAQNARFVKSDGKWVMVAGL